MIDIILVNYNGLEDTLACIESLKKIDRNDYEIIIVDNGSADGSLGKLKKLQLDKVIVLDSGGNLGFSGGNNMGINYALEHCSDYVLLLNNDTLVEPDFLTHMIEAEEVYENNAIITAKILYEFDRKTIWYAGGEFNFKTSRTSSCGINEIDSGKYDLMRPVTFISGCCMLIPVKAIKEVGLMEEDYFLYCEDTDYGCRFTKHGYILAYQPLSRIYHKVSATTSKLSDLMNYYIVRNKLVIIKRHVEKTYRYVAYFYVLLESFKRMVFREYNLKSVIKAYIHFVKGKTGKV
jgi:hypothetical protein